MSITKQLKQLVEERLEEAIETHKSRRQDRRYRRTMKQIRTTGRFYV